jgi:hypothetical protein
VIPNAHDIVAEQLRVVRGIGEERVQSGKRLVLGSAPLATAGVNHDRQFKSR